MDWLSADQAHVWHPYSAMDGRAPVFPVVSASGVRLQLADGRQLIDGMASWWAVIHGYNHPALNQALHEQVEVMSHVMFGGLTHPVAVNLAVKLVELTPLPLQKVFFCDSGSVAVEVAIKMALQYWVAQGQSDKNRLLTLRSGYHGDTFGAMSVCDPVNGMHQLFHTVLPTHYFSPAPQVSYDDEWDDEDLIEFQRLIAENHQQIAAVILEPIVQGAGGMRIYHPQFLAGVRRLCDDYQVLLIIDEIATGFGRTGKLFAAEHAGVTADILCVGKALTGGYMSLAATLTTEKISEGISKEGGVLMHGPTFMANPLACRVALASIDLLLSSPWQQWVQRIDQQLRQGLLICKDWPQVVDIRILGALGIIEMTQAVDMKQWQPRFVELGVWVRPFGKLVYLMPPFVINREDLDYLIRMVVRVVSEMKG
jgi:adenosylmethionine---8-amino-7-oxononanoate aminotransferase